MVFWSVLVGKESCLVGTNIGKYGCFIFKVNESKAVEKHPRDEQGEWLSEPGRPITWHDLWIEINLRKRDESV